VSALNSSPRRGACLIIGFLFLIWSAVFIYQTSFIAVDGHRYFCLFDDAMVSMRYGWNLSHGFGLVWNPGERVEGYTNPLLVMLMAVTTLVLSRSNAVFAIQILGILWPLSTAWVCSHIARRLAQWSGYDMNVQATSQVLTFLCVVFYYPFDYWSLMGMETGLLSFLLCFGVLNVLKYTNDQTKKSVVNAALLFGLAFLTRNDSIVVPLISGVYLALFFRNRILITGFLIYLMFILAQESFRWFYYGDLLPNTYYLRLAGMPLFVRLRNGTVYFYYFLQQTYLIWMVAMVGLLFTGARRSRLYLFAIACGIALYQIYAGGDPWPYWRILTPAMLIIFVLYVLTVCESALALRRRLGQDSSLWIYQTCAALIVCFTLLWSNWAFFLETTFLVNPYQALSNARNVNTAILLNQVLDDNASIGVFWAGSIPYYTGKKAIDFLGKSDKRLSRRAPDLEWIYRSTGMKTLPGHNKYDLTDSIMQRRPTYAQSFAWGRQNLNAWGRMHYKRFVYLDLVMPLLKESPHVRWAKVNGAAPLWHD
jgi:hypothetical protein